MRRSFLLFFTCILMSVSGHAQKWYDMMKDPKRFSFKQVEKAYTLDKETEEGSKLKTGSRNDKEEKEGPGIKDKLIDEEDEDGEDAKFNRFKWFWEQRLDKNGNYPDEERAFSEWKNFETKSGSKSGLMRTNASVFTSQGPFSAGESSAGIGRIDYIGFHPTDANTFYPVSNGGQLWKTTDGGGSYSCLTDALQPTRIYQVKVDISNPNRVLFSQSQLRRLYESLNGGTSWDIISTPDVFSDILQNPDNPREWFATCYIDLYKSTDNAKTWVKAGTIPGYNQISNLTIKPGSNGSVLYCTSNYTSLAFLRSDNGGSTWTNVASWPTGSEGRIAVCPSAPNLVEVCAQTAANGFDGIYKSTDAGLSFTKVFTGTPSNNLFSYNYPPTDLGGNAYWGFTFEINPLNPNEQFCGCINNWRSNDGGLTWQILTTWGNYSPATNVPITHADKHFLKFNPYFPTALYDCHDGGIDRSTDKGNSWSFKSNRLAVTQIYRVTPPPPNAIAKYSIIGTQDNGTKIKHGTGEFLMVLGADGMDNEIDPTNSNTCYVSYQNGNFFRSDDGGNTIGPYLNQTIPGGSNGSWVTPIVLDTSFRTAGQPATVYLALYQKLCKSYDKGNSWTVIQNDSWNFYPTLLNVNRESNIIVGYLNQLWRTTNSGVSWLRIDESISSYKSFTSIVTDPKNADRIWATNATSTEKIWYSANGGISWQNISYNLPYGSYNSIAIDFSTVPETLYISSDNGIAMKAGTATSWSVYGTGLPYVGINEVQIDRSNNTLGVATYGRGLWSVPLAGGSGITFSGKIFLQGAYNAVTGLMNTSLNSSGILQVKALQQPYNNTNFNYAGTETVSGNFFPSNPDIVDWVLIELRDALSPSSILAKKAAFVTNTGTLVDIDGTTANITFPGMSPGNYFIAVRHRNHLGIRSALPLNFSSGTAYHDFTASADQSFQNQAYTSTFQLNSVWAMRAGNANSNDNTKYNGPDNDQDRIQNTKLGGLLSQVLSNQYAPEDLNMDGIVKANGPDNDQNFLLNIVLIGLLSTIFTEQL